MKTPRDSRILACGRPKTHSPKAPTPEKTAELKQRLKVYLSEQNLKFTEQRWTIAQSILMTGGHLDAQEIVKKARKEDPTLGPATVYRTLKVLSDAGILEKSHQEVGGQILYEVPQDEHHDHIICLDCREIIEFHDAKIEQDQAAIAKKLDFRIEGHRHVIYAHCEYLKKKK